LLHVFIELVSFSPLVIDQDKFDVHANFGKTRMGLSSFLSCMSRPTLILFELIFETKKSEDYKAVYWQECFWAYCLKH